MFNLKNEVEGAPYLQKCWCISKLNDKKVRGALDPPWRYVHSFSGHLSSTIGIWVFLIMTLIIELFITTKQVYFLIMILATNFSYWVGFFNLYSRTVQALQYFFKNRILNLGKRVHKLLKKKNNPKNIR